MLYRKLCAQTIRMYVVRFGIRQQIFCKTQNKNERKICSFQLEKNNSAAAVITIDCFQK